MGILTLFGSSNYSHRLSAAALGQGVTPAGVWDLSLMGVFLFWEGESCADKLCLRSWVEMEFGCPLFLSPFHNLCVME